MASDVVTTGEPIDMGTSALPGRHVLDIAAVRELSRRSDLHGLLRFGVHLLVMTGTGFLIWLAQPHWYLMIPAMILHGFTIVTMFAPMHECVHRTAFDTRILNEIAGWIAGLLSFYNFTYYRYYHTWHHRFTQDPARDPELMSPKPRTMWEYFLEISGITFWLPRLINFPKMALGLTKQWPFVPDNARGKVALSASIQLVIYIAGIVSIALGYNFVLLYWFLPAMLAQPLLRAILIAEHTGCTLDENGLTNTRTTLTQFPVRLLMWNMPYHTEHHLYPSIPFFLLPQAHRQIRESLANLEPSYVAANRKIIRSLMAVPREGK